MLDQNEMMRQLMMMSQEDRDALFKNVNSSNEIKPKDNTVVING